MPNRFGWDDSDIKIQFNHARQFNWLPFFIAAANRHGVGDDKLMAIASRETNLDPRYCHMTGDNGNGHGLMQIDIRSYPEHCNSGAWQLPEKNIEMGAKVLAEKLAEAHEAKLINPGDDIVIAIAGYNGGTHRALEAYREGNVDKHTTHGNYSADVFTRSLIFSALLQEYKHDA